MIDFLSAALTVARLHVHTMFVLSARHRKIKVLDEAFSNLEEINGEIIKKKQRPWPF